MTPEAIERSVVIRTMPSDIRATRSANDSAGGTGDGFGVVVGSSEGEGTALGVAGTGAGLGRSASVGAGNRVDVGVEVGLGVAVAAAAAGWLARGAEPAVGAGGDGDAGDSAVFRAHPSTVTNAAADSSKIRPVHCRPAGRGIMATAAVWR